MQLVKDCGIRRIGFQGTAGRHSSVAALVLMRDILKASQGLRLFPCAQLHVLLVACHGFQFESGWPEAEVHQHFLNIPDWNGCKGRCKATV